MSITEIISDTVKIDPRPGERRARARFACHVKTLYSRRGDGEDLARGEATWSLGRIVDVSRRGIALVLQRFYVPGTVLTLQPLLPKWKPLRELGVRTANLRPGPGHGVCAGCALTRGLDGDELQALLQNL